MEYSQISFLDTDPSLQSNGTNTPVTSSEDEPQTDGSTDLMSGKATLESLPHMTTKDEWISFMQDSLAKILASQGIQQGLAKVRGLDFTVKFYALQTRFDLNTCSWKTSQTSLLEMTEECSEPSLETLPHAAMMLSGYVYPLPKLEPTIPETVGGSWVTPTASSSQAASMKASLKEAERLHPKGQNHLAAQMAKRMFPTPCANEDAAGTPNGKMQRQLGNCEEVRGTTPEEWAGGTLNPTWVEWLMGFPVGHTDLEP